MQPPKLTATPFAVLCGLIDGKPRTLPELRERIGWTFSKSHLIVVVKRLAQDGLVKKFDELNAAGKRARRVVQITSAGIEAWEECSRFYADLRENFGEPGFPMPLPRVRPVVNPSPGPGPSDRLPSRAEMEAILKNAPPEFRLIYPVVRALDVSPAHIVGLNVEDVCRPKNTIDIQGQPQRLSPAIFALVQESIAGRGGEEPLFLNAYGVRWSVHELAYVFRGLREAAGLPKTIKLRGRKNSWKYQKRLQSPKASREPARL